MSLLLRNLPSLQQLHLHGLSFSASLPSSLTSLTLSGRPDPAVLTSISNCVQLQQLTFQEALLPISFSSEELWSTLTPLTALSALEGTLRRHHYAHVTIIWGDIGSEAPSSLPVVQRLKRLCLKEESRQLLNKQQVSGFMVAKGDISMLTKLESLCLDMTTGRRDTGPASVKLPENLLELHTSALSTGRTAWSDLSSLKQLSIEVTLTEVRPTVSMEGVSSTLRALTMQQCWHGVKDPGHAGEKFTWWGHVRGISRGCLHLRPVTAPSLREVVLFIVDWPELGLGHVPDALVRAAAERMFSRWPNMPETF